jgi:hypothetical protein
MIVTNPPSDSDKPNVMKWLGKFSGISVILYLGLSNYTIIYNTDKESQLFQIASFFMPYVFYTACASLITLGVLFVYQKRGDAGFRNSWINALKKCALYILLPSVVIAIVILTVAVNTGQLNLSETPFW